jgi:hypothetical protein
MKLINRRTALGPKPEYQDLWDALASDYQREIENVRKNAFWQDARGIYDSITREDYIRAAFLLRIEEINERYERQFLALTEDEPEGHA